MKTGRLFRATVLFALCFLLVEAVSFAALAGPTPEELITDSAAVIREMTGQEDVQTMAELVKKAKGIAVFPRVVKAGLIIGGDHGSGLVLRRDAARGKWYGPSFIEITGFSWGLQVGVKSTQLVLVVTNQSGMNVFKGDKVTLGGEFSVAAGPVGRQAQAGTDVELSASIYSYSISKGLFAGFSLEGAKIDDDPNANRAYWGTSVDPATILAERAADARVNVLIRELAQLIAKAE